MIINMKTWEPSFLPTVMKLVKIKCNFNRMLYTTGRVTRKRAILVAKGFTQTHGVDSAELFSPVSKYSSLGFLLSLNVLRQYIILRLKFKNAFLDGMLTE